MTLMRLVARPMLASMFVVGGYGAIRNPEAIAPRVKPITDRLVPLAKRVMPSVSIPEDTAKLVRLTGLVQVVAGIALATGKSPRVASLALVATSLPATLTTHRFWEESDPSTRADERAHFLKNVSMTGGLLLAGVDTAGKPGLAWRAQNAAKGAQRQTKHAKGVATREAKHAKRAARREAKLARKSLPRG
jgi:putative oxidoreductase